MKLNHLAIQAKDLKASQEFYVRYFGFQKPSETGPDGFLKDKNGFVLVIDQAEQPEVPKDLHFGFFLESPEAVQALYEQMKQEGVPLTSELSESRNSAGKRVAVFFCHDPSGYTVELRA